MCTPIRELKQSIITIFSKCWILRVLIYFDFWPLTMMLFCFSFWFWKINKDCSVQNGF